MKFAAPVLSLSIAFALSACATVPIKPAPLALAAPAAQPAAAPAPPVVVAADPVGTPDVAAPDGAPAVTGTASWYRTGKGMHRTSSGQMLNNNALTAASFVFPMGTKLRVGRIDGDRSVVVLVNDRMPHNHRLVDLSELAARELGLMGCGIATVTATPIVVASAP